MAAEPEQNDDATKQASTGDYVVVARRYRPQAFEELIGQEHVAKALTGAIQTNRIGHAYLFTGARGVGKTSAARILAKALQCVDGPTPTPCGKCDVCLSIASGGDVDVLEIDGASNRGIDEIRQLRQNVNIRPSRGHFKIYIIDEVHMLTGPAFNALLKTLEEPPEHVKFIFCTTEPNKIPITVLSRCQRFDFAGIQVDAIVTRLTQIVEAEGLSASPEALVILARRAAGSMRDSQSLLEQMLAVGIQHVGADDVHTMLGTADGSQLTALARQLVAGDAAAALGLLDKALTGGVDVGQLLEQLLGCFRDAMVSAVGCDADAFLHTNAEEDKLAINEIAKSRGLETIFAILQLLEEAISRLRFSTHRRTIAEVALVRISKLGDLDDLAGVVAELRSGTSTGPAPSRPASPSVAKKKSDSPVSSSLKSPPAASGQNEASTKQQDAPERQDITVAADVNPGAVSDSTAPVSDGTSAPERSPTPEPSPTPVGRPLTETSAESIWEEALGRLSGSGLIAAKGRQYDSVAISAPNRLEVTFKETYNLCKAYCERPDQLGKIERSLQEVTGTRTGVNFLLSPDDPAETPKPAATKKVETDSPMKRIVDAEDEPIVRQAKELFGARVTRVD